MPSTLLQKLTLISIIAVALSSCNGQLVALPTPTSTNPPPTSTVKAGDLCANPLVPVKAGATWTYHNRSSEVGSSVFTAQITTVHPDGFTVAAKFNDAASSDQDWACQPEGIVPVLPAAGQTALSISWEGVQADFSTSNPTGVVLPASVESGTKWQYGVDITGTLSQGSLSANLNGSVSSAMQAVGTESVTVPAGTFKATKIQSVSTFKVSADFHGLSLPITSVVNTTFWFTPGVGWVKSVETGELVGTSVNATTELQSYTIP